MQFTILFDPPFYVGIVEQERGGKLYAARVVFGPEPNNEQVYAFVLRELTPVLRGMTHGVPVAEAPPERRINPKRQQRAVQRMMGERGVSSKAHDAMRLQREANKTVRQQRTKSEREAERATKRQRKVEKARQKHRGH